MGRYGTKCNTRGHNRGHYGTQTHNVTHVTATARHGSCSRNLRQSKEDTKRVKEGVKWRWGEKKNPRRSSRLFSAVECQHSASFRRGKKIPSVVFGDLLWLNKGGESDCRVLDFTFLFHSSAISFIQEPSRLWHSPYEAGKWTFASVRHMTWVDRFWLPSSLRRHLITENLTKNQTKLLHKTPFRWVDILTLRQP